MRAGTPTLFPLTGGADRKKAFHTFAGISCAPLRVEQSFLDYKKHFVTRDVRLHERSIANQSQLLLRGMSGVG